MTRGTARRATARRRLAAAAAGLAVLAGCTTSAEPGAAPASGESAGADRQTASAGPDQAPTPPLDEATTEEHPVHEAIDQGDGGSRHLEAIRVLVATGSDVAAPSAADGATPAEHARARGQDAVAELLRRALREDEATSRPAAGKGPSDAADRRLSAAAAAGDADQAALALRAGANLEARDNHQRTPLLLAAQEDHVDVARLLVALGADPDALDDRHDTPWLVTGVTGSVPMLEALLAANPDLTIVNRYGGVSVIPASERGHVAYVRRVTRTDIDVNHVNDLGWTALLEAVILGDGTKPYQRIVETLLSAGADPRIPDNAGVTALEHAERAGQRAVASILRRADED